MATFLAEGLTAGEGCVLVATPGHQVAIVRALRAAGVDPAPIVAIDARDTLERILRSNGQGIDPVRFQDVVDHVLRKAGSRAEVSRVRIFGEMVALLWDQGLVTEATELEARWNDALRSTTRPFTLLCGYRMPRIADDRDAAGRYLDVCGVHTAVRAAGAAEPSAWRRFGGGADELPGARAFVRSTLGAWDWHGLATEATLVVTELATNAVLHARTAFHVSVSRRADRRGVRIAVHDGCEAPPAVRHYSPGASTGRGLHLIRALSSGWGVEHFAGGKSVWAELTHAAR